MYRVVSAVAFALLTGCAAAETLELGPTVPGDGAPDAGSRDVGVRLDSGVPPDAGLRRDGGVRSDGGVRPDGGTRHDGGLRDGGFVVCTPATNLLVGGGFEQNGTVRHPAPRWEGEWGGDRASVVDEGRDGIEPLEGRWMLRFDATSPSGASSSVGSEIFQLVSMSPFTDEIAAGQRLVLRVAYNRVDRDFTTDHRFTTHLWAYEGSIFRFFPELYREETPVAAETVHFDSDDHAASWEVVEASIVVPPNADFVMVGIVAAEDSINDTNLLEFHGHYADDVCLRWVP